jgi:electron transport complex protein RnfC
MNIKLARFPGGLHLSGHKQESTTLAVMPAPIPPYLVLPLQQHIGAPAKALVKVGDKVLKGQVIAQADGYVSIPLHASSSGTVVEIGLRPVPHPSGLPADCIVIETDGADRWVELQPMDNYTQISFSALRNSIREAGIAGLGGAGFPTFIKLNPGPDKTVDTLILNGVECEPYITCDDMLMRERPEQIIAGLLMVRHALQARECIIAVEDNKPEAADAMNRLIGTLRLPGVTVVQVPTLYPAGGAKQLIKVLTGKEVPRHQLSIQIGVVCLNVGTAAAVYRSIEYGEPLISRYVTVTGPGVKHARNLEVLLGTPMSELIKQCGGDLSGSAQIKMGGPMMGITIKHAEAPVIKTTNCILVEAKQATPKTAMPCIRCGACSDVCPVSLLPQQLYWHARARDFEKIEDYKLFDCIECGCCEAVCPSHISLVNYYRYAKTEIATNEREKQKADTARKRHEFRQERLARDKAERTARLEQKKAGFAQPTRPDQAAADITKP